MLGRERLRRYLSTEEARRFVADLAGVMTLVADPPLPHPAVCRDADDDYLVESIRNPKAKIVAGFRPIMPPFPAERIDEAEMQDLLAFIKSLKEGQTPTRNEQTPPPENAPEGP